MRGISLLEVLVVLAVVMIFCSLTVHFLISTADQLLVRKELENIYLVFCAMQQQAILEDAEKVLDIDVNGRCYRCDGSSYQLCSMVCFGAPTDVLGPPSHPTSVIINPVSFSQGRVVFYPDGMIQAGALYLTDIKRRWAYALSCGVSHTVYIRRYHYEKGRWVLIS